MDFNELITRRKAIRRFKDETPAKEDIRILIDAASFAHSIGNRQVLRFTAVITPEKVETIFRNSSLGNINDGEEGFTPQESAPKAFLLITAPPGGSPANFADAGAAFQNMALAAHEEQIGLYWIHAFAGKLLHRELQLADDRRIIAVIAVGLPGESPVMVSIDPEESVDYFDRKDLQPRIPKLKATHLLNWL